MAKLRGLRVVLTGANSGIGLEMLKLLCRDNTVLAADRNTDIISEMGGNVIPYRCDVSSREGVDRLFQTAEEVLGGIDVFCANAGFAYYEKMDYEDWDRIESIYRTNTISPIYSYQKFVRHVGGRKGIFALTDSAMGIMGMPGFSVYTSTKFAVNGFQDTIRHEKPDNIQITTIYPVSTDTAFFHTDTGVTIVKPFPVQTPQTVAKCMVRGMEKGRRRVYPCRIFRASMVLFALIPPVKWAYVAIARRQFENYVERVGTLSGGKKDN